MSTHLVLAICFLFSLNTFLRLELSPIVSSECGNIGRQLDEGLGTDLLPFFVDGQTDFVDVDGLLAQRRDELSRVRKDLFGGLARLVVGEEGRHHDRNALGQSVRHLRRQK